ncbi:MAG: hypothetical protein WBL44_11435 [Nitrososphaeraceae archaeon]|jgi:hypothetical protein
MTIRKDLNQAPCMKAPPVFKSVALYVEIKVQLDLGQIEIQLARGLILTDGPIGVLNVVTYQSIVIIIEVDAMIKEMLQVT